MTAEVALLNKHAVALAADSAVTISGPAASKVYNAANKLFALSKWEPVGIMVYGNAEYMGVPWETIIKVYRERLGKRSFDELEEYFDDFMSFLGSNDDLFGSAAQASHVRGAANTIYTEIREEIRKLVDAKTKADPSNGLTDAERDAVVAGAITDFRVRAGSFGKLQGYAGDPEASIRKEYESVILDSLAKVFDQLPISETQRTALLESLVLVLSRDAFPQQAPGVVVAGFGSREHFPILCTTTVEARLAGQLKRKPTTTHRISGDQPALVVPFAQTDAVQLFVEGIDPRHALTATKLVGETLDRFTDDILSDLDMSEEDKAKATADWKQLAKTRLREFSDQAKAVRQRTYIEPLVRVISALPKDELAAVAEALVNITSLRRKVSMDADTVGGPIDVAVISKGDGLVWLQRKHYFKPELNPQFFETYFYQRHGGAP